MLGIPAVAISTVTRSDAIEDYRPAARLAAWVLGQLLAAGLTGGDLINVNIPDLRQVQPKGLRVVPQSTAEIEDTYHADGPAASLLCGGDERVVGSCRFRLRLCHLVGRLRGTSAAWTTAFDMNSLLRRPGGERGGRLVV